MPFTIRALNGISMVVDVALDGDDEYANVLLSMIISRINSNRLQKVSDIICISLCENVNKPEHKTVFTLFFVWMYFDR